MSRYYCKICGSEFTVGQKFEKGYFGDSPPCPVCLMISKEVYPTVKIHDYETPEQYEARTGKAWPENWGVYVRGFDKKECGCAFGHAEQFYHEWVITTYENAKWIVSRDYFLNVIIICATEAGIPPDGWEPEVEK
jgi:hypothetical protein